jgi:xylulokinase
VHLAPTLTGEEGLTRRSVGRLAAQVLRDAVRDGMVVGIGDGAAVSAAADAMEDVESPVAATVVPLCGGFWIGDAAREPYRRVADALGATARPLPAPGLLEDSATRDALLRHAGVKQIRELWDRLDVGLFGIGGPSWSEATVGADVARELAEAGAIGEVLISPFDADGRFVGEKLRSRVIGFDARELAGVPLTIAVAHGRSKVAPMLAALRAGIVRTLVTDVATAELLAAEIETGATVVRHRSRPKAVLAADIGTTEAKVGLVALDGTLIALERARYELDADPGTGRAEQDAEQWWTALTETTRRLVARDAAEVVAICVDGHGPTLVPTDDAGRPSGPAITWLDSRASAEAAEIAANTGLSGWGLGILPAALRLERHAPEIAERSRWYLNTWDALALRLSGVARASVTTEAGPATPAEIGFQSGKLPERIQAGAVVGHLTPEAADALSLQPGIPVVAGVVDAFASFHGAGMLKPGDAIDVGGGAGGFGVYWDRVVEAAGAFVTPAPLPGLFVVGGAMAATGKSLDWFRDDILGSGASTDELLREAASTPAGAGGVVFLPYLAGERSPLWDPHARGAFVGLRLDHDRGHLTRAILEAAALAIRHVAEPILNAGVTVTSMRLAGGPARSEAWNQLKADITGFPVDVPHVLETAVVGSAILGAVGVGEHADLPAAIRAMTRVERRLEPRTSVRPTYDELYRTYRLVHPALRAVVP